MEGLRIAIGGTKGSIEGYRRVEGVKEGWKGMRDKRIGRRV